MGTIRVRFKEIFSGSPEDLGKGGFLRWMRELREGSFDNVELQALYDVQVQALLPGERIGYRPQFTKWVQAVGQVVDGTCFIVTTPIWGIVVYLSEGRFDHTIWLGTYDDRRRLAAAARAVRQFLVNEESGPYQEPAPR